MLKLRRRKTAPSPYYYCPTANEIESAVHGGFTTCCSDPYRHTPLPGTEATEVLSRALSDAAVQREQLRQRLAEADMIAAAHAGCPTHYVMEGRRTAEVSGPFRTLALAYNGDARHAVLDVDGPSLLKKVTVENVTGASVRIEPTTLNVTGLIDEALARDLSVTEISERARRRQRMIITLEIG